MCLCLCLCVVCVRAYVCVRTSDILFNNLLKTSLMCALLVFSRMSPDTPRVEVTPPQEALPETPAQDLLAEPLWPARRVELHYGAPRPPTKAIGAQGPQDTV